MTTNGRASRVIAFTGLPGTGKSTLAESLAVATGVPVFNGDWLMGALKPVHRELGEVERPRYLAMYEGLLGSLVTRQLMFGQSAIVDDVIDDRIATSWQEIVADYQARLFVVECVCTDAAEHRRRLEGRQRGIPGWHEIGWDHVERMRAESAPLTVPRLTVDAMTPVEDNMHRIQEYLGDTCP